jgi:hypothetical protein
MRRRLFHHAAPLALAGALLALATAGTPAIAQQSRLDTKSNSTFTLDPARQRVNVVVDIVITSRTPSSVRRGPCPSDPGRTCRITTNYYTERWGFLAIQHGARNLKIRGPGATARVASQNDTYKNYSIGFDRIERGQTARLKVTYHLPAARAIGQQHPHLPGLRALLLARPANEERLGHRHPAARL